MRKTLQILLVTLSAFLFHQQVFAFDADDCGKPRGKYRNISFSYGKMTPDGLPELHCDYGAALTFGRTYYLHRPIANCVRFGIDAGWTDINFENYKVSHIYTGYYEKYSILRLDVGMHIGPSVTLNLFKRFQAQAYFHYDPSFVGMYNGYDEEFHIGYGNIFTGGISVNYGVIGVGIEKRFGNSKMDVYSDDCVFPDQYDPDTNTFSESQKGKTDFSGFRAYISFRF